MAATPGSLRDFINYLDENREKLMPEAIYIEGERKGIPIENAMQYNTGYTENLHSYVNDINTHEGGTHLAGFRSGLTRTLKAYADRSGLLQKAKVEITGDDFRGGATNMYLAGIPTIAIMKITGHKTEKEFMKYIKITEEQTAMELMNHPYFAGRK